MSELTISTFGRLDTHASQRAFRALLDALSRPGLLGRLDSPAGVPVALVPALALADVDVSTCVLTEPEAPDWAAVLSAATGAVPAPVEQAEIVVALRVPTPDEVRSLRRGRAEAPELGARLMVGCRALTTDGPGVVLRLAGPGVPGTRRVAIDGLPVEVFEALASANRAFPAGVDTFVVADGGALLGLPRSTDLQIGG